MADAYKLDCESQAVDCRFIIQSEDEAEAIELAKDHMREGHGQDYSDEDLWAACIGGAEQIDRYTTAIEDAGFSVTDVRENTQYEFISERAANACQKYGVKSISLGATR